jgi:plasmid stability protein
MRKRSQEGAWLSAKVPSEMRAELWRLAATHDRSVSAEVRSAVRLHLRLADAAAADRDEPPEAA